MSNGVVVLLSGGMDSSTLLATAVTFHDTVHALSVDYNQRHKRELESAKKVAYHYGVSHEILDITNINNLIGGSSLTSADISVPHGHYADKTMKQTVVPGRNLILLSLATGMAISRGINMVAYAAHAGDHAIYPDCRPDFVMAMMEVLQNCDYNPIGLWTPFLYLDKAQILQSGLRLKVPYELTWTCYEGREKACGKCGACVERLEAFKLNNMEDPLEYE